MGVRNLLNKKQEVTLSGAKTFKLPSITIDYPQENETIMPGHYAVRLSASPFAEVEISINGGDWKPCRNASGYYWYDWWAESGYVKIMARFKVLNGDWKKSKERKVSVISPTPN